MIQTRETYRSKQVKWDNPLHVSNFFNEKQRFHHAATAKRQELILYIADMHKRALSSGVPPWMIQIPIRLMDLRERCQDYRQVLDAFFDVRQLGYFVDSDKYEFSTITPKPRLDQNITSAVQQISFLSYEPPPRPENGVISKVYVNQTNADTIIAKVIQSKRFDLQAAVEWVLRHPELNFHFAPAGRLQQRDTSIWPIRAIETWPSWLRESLFGAGLDIDSAYTQFLMSTVQSVHNDQKIMNTLYPDLIRSIQDKKAWRLELCEDVLGLEPTEENIGIVKKICMSLANGSKISAPILLSQSAFSITADTVIQTCSDVSPENLIKIGDRLNQISRQYVNARKIACLANRQNITRQNQKNVFNSYFEWERTARYAIWEACDRHGIMVHDGIDGIPKEYLQDIPKLIQELNIKLTS